MTIHQKVAQSEIPLFCQGCKVRVEGICGALNPSQLTALSKQSHRRIIDAGTELIGERQVSHTISTVLYGVVRLTKTLSDGRQQIVGLQFAPDFVGQPLAAESSLSADAATEILICSFPRSVVERLAQDLPDVGRRFLSQALKELDQARDWMVTLGRRTALEKVASFLLLITRNMNRSGGEHVGELRFELPLTRCDIADFLGLTNETVSRQLTRLKSEGAIRIENSRHIIVDDLPRLEAQAGR
ncbi:Crp/Fnr family transcriptional regulator [Labrys miyagiensis]